MFETPLPSGVTSLTGDGTAKLTFDATPGALLGGFGAKLFFTPTAGAVYAAADGKTLTIKVTNGATTANYSNPVIVTAPPDGPKAPFAISPGTAVDVPRLVTVYVDTSGGPTALGLKISDIANGNSSATRRGQSK